MTTNNAAATAAAPTLAGVTWSDVTAATWQPVGDETYTSEVFPGAVLTVSYTTVKAFAAAVDPSLANGEVLTASLDFADGSYVIWERPWYDAYACAPRYDSGKGNL